MRIEIHKGDGRHRLRCIRDDGTRTDAPAGPGLPHHDLAHYVAERALALARGFFGNVAAGRTVAELNDPEVIRTLPEEAWAAETLARALGATATGACRADQFRELVHAELGDGAIVAALTPATVYAMIDDYAALLARWRGLPTGASLALDW